MSSKSNKTELKKIARVIVPAIGMASVVIGLILTINMLLGALGH